MEKNENFKYLKLSFSNRNNGCILLGVDKTWLKKHKFSIPPYDEISNIWVCSIEIIIDSNLNTM